MYRIDIDALSRMSRARQLQAWQDIAAQIREHAVRQRDALIAAEVAEQADAHGEWGSRARAARALDISAQTIGDAITRYQRQHAQQMSEIAAHSSDQAKREHRPE